MQQRSWTSRVLSSLLTTLLLAAGIVSYGPIAAASPDSNAADWYQWRGPNRDGVVTGPAVPIEWPDELHRRWQVEVGTGHSSPVVLGDRIYIHARNEEAEEETLFALRLEDGQTIWQRSYPAPYRMHPAARAFGNGPVSTPVIWDGKLYTLGKASTLSCFDIESGEMLWSDNFSSLFPRTVPLFGAGMSPQIEDGRLLVHLGGPQDGGFMALDPHTGEVIWNLRGDGPSYVSPIVVTIGAQRQIVTHTDSHIVGVAFEDGKLLWRIPFKTEFDQNIITPVLHGQRLILSGLHHPLFAIELVREGDSWTAQELWSNAALSLYMSSPVLAGDRLFGMTHRRKGQFFAVDTATGETLWTSVGREGQNASLVVLGDRIAMLTEEAELLVIDPTAEQYEPLRSYKVGDSQTWAHPVFTGAGILIKDLTSLALWEIPNA